MKSKKETFAGLMNDFLYHFDIPVVFDDFLTITIAAFGQNPRIGKSYDEDLYLETIGKYKHHKLKDHFPKLLGCLITEMEEQLQSTTGNDVLGTYYENTISKKGSGQFFTPWHICTFMVSSLSGDKSETPLRILDPCCGSGRMLVCGGNIMGKHHYFYGIDVDHTCVKMTVVNLFLNGNFHAEVMWADALDPDDFRLSYKTSFLPFGVFRIQNKEQSFLYHAQKEAFRKMAKERVGSSLTLPSDDIGNSIDPNASQLKLF